MPSTPKKTTKKAPTKKIGKQPAKEYTMAHVAAALVIGTVMGLIGAPMFYVSMCG
jgi:hypothetical protein